MDRKQKTRSLKTRHRRVRKKVVGTAERPRLAVYRSNRHIYALVIDDFAGSTLAAASTMTLTAQDQALLQEARDYGIGKGFTVPNHVPGELFGSSHFAVRVGEPFPAASVPAAQALGILDGRLLAEARELVESGQCVSGTPLGVPGDDERPPDDDAEKGDQETGNGRQQCRDRAGGGRQSAAQRSRSASKRKAR